MRADFLEGVKLCVEKGDMDVLQKMFDSFTTANVLDKRTSLDQVLRDYLLVLLSEKKQELTRTAWEQFLNLCIEGCRREIITTTMPVVLLGDMFDASTLDRCEQLFAFVENNVSIWKEEMFFAACKNNLLRMCNDLLRRLSRSQNTVFCGRILLFLAKFFPFSERSGLNIVSEFNLENITEFGVDDTADFKESEDKDDPAEEGKSDRIKIDYNLYTKFWSLQDFFRNPNQCYNKVQWKVFSSHATNVLSAFKSFKLEDVHGKRVIATKPTNDTLSQQHYFAKFLTNQKLLELQLSDVNFRRYVLLQFLILFQYLNCHVKFKSESFELKPNQMEWVKQTTQEVYSLLRETPPDGANFAKTVQHILQREEHWNNWKNDGCPEFQKPVQPADDIIEDDSQKRTASGQKLGKWPRKRLGQVMRDAMANKKYVMGNPELTKLWNHLPDNLEACRGPDRDFLPSLESYFEEAIEQTDPAAMVEEQYKRVNDGNFGWRALRLLARRSPHFFIPSNNPINKLPEYLETMIKKIARDRPSSVAQSGEVKLEPPDTVDPPTVLQNETEDGEDDELLKNDDKQGDIGSQEEMDITRDKQARIKKEQLDAVADLIGENWRKLARKLGFRDDEIEYFATNQAGVASGKYMLHVWSEDSEDTGPEDLSYILEGLGLVEAAKLMKEMAA